MAKEIIKATEPGIIKGEPSSPPPPQPSPGTFGVQSSPPPPAPSPAPVKTEKG